MPAWSGVRCARRSKYFVENVCTSAIAKSAAPIDWMRGGGWRSWRAPGCAWGSGQVAASSSRKARPRAPPQEGPGGDREERNRHDEAGGGG